MNKNKVINKKKKKLFNILLFRLGIKYKEKKTSKCEEGLIYNIIMLNFRYMWVLQTVIGGNLKARYVILSNLSV